MDNRVGRQRRTEGQNTPRGALNEPESIKTNHDKPPKKRENVMKMKAPKKDKAEDSKSFDESLSSFFTSIKGITSVISRASNYSEETSTKEILKDILEAGENIGQMKSSINTVINIDSENLTGKVREVASATAVVLGPLLVKEILKK